MGKFQPIGLIPALVAAELAREMYALGDIVAAEAHVSITAGSASAGRHVPSAPGQPPNNDTGFLARNIEVHQTGPLAVQVRSLAPYAADLEFGTSRMESRPYLRPARDAKAAEIQKRAAQAVNRALRKFARR